MSLYAKGTFMSAVRSALFTPASRESWVADASCAQSDPDAWYPEKGGDPAIQAKRICQSCPVRVECLEEALVRNERFGVWGGLSPQQRIAERRRRGWAPPLPSEDTAA